MSLQTNSIGISRASRRGNRMTATTTSRDHQTFETVGWQPALMRFLPAWIILSMVLSILLPNALSVGFGTAAATVTGSTAVVENIITGAPLTTNGIAPLFTAQVDRWQDDILRWSGQYGVDPNLMATVMQIESCGQAEVSSHAGAQGLFQVMPFHFAPGEVYTDPDTNALRSANFLNECLGWSNGDIGLTLACYNGGPSVTSRPYTSWPSETQRYYNWGVGIYNDAKAGLAESPTLNDWLGAGGSNLCR